MLTGQKYLTQLPLVVSEEKSVLDWNKATIIHTPLNSLHSQLRGWCHVMVMVLTLIDFQINYN